MEGDNNELTIFYGVLCLGLRSNLT